MKTHKQMAMLWRSECLSWQSRYVHYRDLHLNQLKSLAIMKKNEEFYQDIILSLFAQASSKEGNYEKIVKETMLNLKKQR